MTISARRIVEIIEPEPVIEGAGVRLKRSIGTPTLDYLDPFLLFDDFTSGNPRDYEAGFPLHPHRGIETVTYVLKGEVQHRDTLGNAGSIGAGDIQWMTAGRGIMHEEMPQVRPGGIAGFQLWVNLPAKLKMTKPRYQDIRSGEIREITRETGARIRVITGTVDGITGPVTEIAADPTYLDIFVPPHTSLTHPIERGHTAFAYVFEGEARFQDGMGTNDPLVSHAHLVVFGDGDFITVMTGPDTVRLLLVSGLPLSEPIARYGPFVMNTEKEIEQTLLELRQGTFVTT
ncbi:MAG: pirin family protein [Nitrospirota bacterium]|nr:pirin family protein [Nitrospirota bacterium]